MFFFITLYLLPIGSYPLSRSRRVATPSPTRRGRSSAQGPGAFLLVLRHFKRGVGWTGELGERCCCRKSRNSSKSSKASRTTKAARRPSSVGESGVAGNEREGRGRRETSASSRIVFFSLFSACAGWGVKLQRSPWQQQKESWSMPRLERRHTEEHPSPSSQQPCDTICPLKARA